jgi:hypothetical protein
MRHLRDSSQWCDVILYVQGQSVFHARDCPARNPTVSALYVDLSVAHSLWPGCQRVANWECAQCENPSSAARRHRLPVG